MSDSNITVKNSVSFNDYLNLDYSKIQAESSYHTANAEAQRAMAVSCALDLIRTKLSINSSIPIKSSLDSLPVYADLIQEALKVNNK